jgi:hypothetical protein
MNIRISSSELDEMISDKQIDELKTEVYSLEEVY